MKLLSILCQWLKRCIFKPGILTVLPGEIGKCSIYFLSIDWLHSGKTASALTWKATETEPFQNRSHYTALFANWIAPVGTHQFLFYGVFACWRSFKKERNNTLVEAIIGVAVNFIYLFLIHFTVVTPPPFIFYFICLVRREKKNSYMLWIISKVNRIHYRNKSA